MLAWLPSEEAEGKIMLKKKYSDSPHQLDPTSKLVLQSAAWAAAQRIKDLWLPKGCTKKIPCHAPLRVLPPTSDAPLSSATVVYQD